LLGILLFLNFLPIINNAFLQGLQRFAWLSTSSAVAILFKIALAATLVWWGYGLFADRVGDFVSKTMSECTGREILVELFSHLGFLDDIAALLESTNCVPCMLPYTTSQFMPRTRGDRPSVIPEGTVNLAFVGQYCEIPDNVVYTVEYSVHSARLAVASLLALRLDIAPTYEGLDHPNALVEALRRILQ